YTAITDFPRLHLHDALPILSASEGTRLVLGEDCMLASEVQLRTDDAHPIFDVHTGLRINPAEDIVIGAHVWLAYGVRCLGGARIDRKSTRLNSSHVKISYAV